MKPSTKRQMTLHAKREYPREACGLVAGDKYYPCENTAEEGRDAFRISAERWAEIEEIAPIEAVFHSHPDWPSTPSEADKASCEASGLPWLIVSVREGGVIDGWSRIDPEGHQTPLVGRAFVHGVHDCLSIILDYYKRERDVDLGSYDRKDEWWNKGGNLYLENLPAAGFVQVFSPQQGDVILMQIRSPVPNHAGIFLADGIIASEPEHYPAPSSILHHMYGQLSRRDVYGGYWAENTVSIWRYVGKD